MSCPHCGADNPGDAKACIHCGESLALTCPQCHTEPPPHARFCFACGARIDAPPSERPAQDPTQRLQRLVPKEFAERLLATRGQVTPERRIVTLLFSDVTGSTAMAEHLQTVWQEHLGVPIRLNLRQVSEKLAEIRPHMLLRAWAADYGDPTVGEELSPGGLGQPLLEGRDPGAALRGRRAMDDGW